MTPFIGSPAVLSFPNESRSYDSTRRAVRFWGYEGAFERPFLVTEEALRHVQPGVAANEEKLLRAFDLNRALIYATASKVYARGGNRTYELVAGDFQAKSAHVSETTPKRGS